MTDATLVVLIVALIVVTAIGSAAAGVLTARWVNRNRPWYDA